MDLLKQIADLANTSGHSIRQWNEKDQKWWYKPVNAPVTDDVIEHHLKRGDDCVGIWLNKDDGDTSHFCVFDLDDHKKQMCPERMLEHAHCIGAALHDRGVQFAMFLSGSGHGVHIWVLFDKAKRVDSIKAWSDKILEHASKLSPTRHTYVRKPGGQMWNGPDATSEVEVLPKGKGKHVVALPYGRDSHLLGACDGGSRIVQIPDMDAELIPFKGGKTGPAKGGGSKKEIDKDAAFDCFVLQFDPDVRDQWGAAALCLQAAFGVDDEWAESRWVEWSKTSPAYERGDEKQWKTTGSSRYSPITFWLYAKDHGYTGDTPFNATDSRKLTALSFLDDVRLLRDHVGTAYAELSARNFVPVGSAAFRNRVALGLHREKGITVDETALKSVAILAEALASETKCEKVWLRFGQAGGKRYLFLADDDCTVIEIDGDGWRVADDAPIVFRRGDCLPMSMPETADIQELCDFLNVDDDNLPFLLAWMVTAIYFPGGNCPIALLDGPAGSGKSSALRTIISTIDPKVGAQSGEPKSEDDLFAAAYNAGTVSGDNFSSMAKISDPLCRLATGGGIRKRKLYTDHDVVSLDVKRPILIAGIDPTFYANDLAERIVRIELHRPETYINDMQFDRQLDESLSRFTGAVLDLVVECINHAHEIEDGASRFATYGRVGEVVSRKLGREAGWFTEEAALRHAELAGEIADADSVYAYIVRLIASETEDQLEMTAGQIWEEMQQAVEQHEISVPRDDMPRNPKQMSGRISRALPLLKKDHGIHVARGARRSFVFTWDGPAEVSVKEMMAIMNASRKF